MPLQLGQQQQRACANTFFDVSPFVIPQDPMAAVRKPHAAGQTTEGHTEMLADPIEKTAQGRLALGPELFIRQPCRSSEQSALTEGLPFLLLQGRKSQGQDSHHLTTTPQENRLPGGHQHARCNSLEGISDSRQHSEGRRPFWQIRPAQALATSDRLSV